jgi:peptide/nickel transport system substrate-binding protein
VIGVFEEPDTLNFSLAHRPASIWVLACLDARLVRVRHDNSLEPQILAELPTLENGGVSPDGRTYTLRFRAGLRWSDGEPLDGRDFLFTWQLLTDPAYPATSRAGWELIQSIELSSDSLTATVYLERPAASFVDTVLVGIGERPSGFLLPAHALEGLTPLEIVHSDYGALGHLSSGPFVLVDWQAGEQLVLERNPHYEMSEVFLDRIVFRVLPGVREALHQLASGEVDLVVGLPEWSLAELRAHPDLSTLVTQRGGAVAMLMVNLNHPGALDQPHPILTDRRVRQALLLGFDRQRVADTLLLGSAPVAATPLDFTLWQAGMGHQMPAAYDPERARRLLDDAGWHSGPDGIRRRDGEPLQLTLGIDGRPERDLALKRQIATAFAEDMRAIGIDVRIVPLTEPIRERAHDLFLCWCNDRATPAELAAMFSSAAIPTGIPSAGRNVMGYRSAVVDQLLTAQDTAVDWATRIAILQRIQQQLAIDLPVIPIYVHVDIVTGHGHVKGLAPGPTNGIWWNPESWWVSREEATP